METNFLKYIMNKHPKYFFINKIKSSSSVTPHQPLYACILREYQINDLYQAAVRSIFRNISVSCVFDQFVETYFQSDPELYSE
jgi:hypothetical protein